MSAPAQEIFIFLFTVIGLTLSRPLLPQLTQEWASYYDRDLKGPGTYAFGYDVEDPKSGNVQYRHEEKHLNGSVTGSYGLLEPDGNLRVIHYTADSEGFRAVIENSSGKLEHWPPLVPVSVPVNLQPIPGQLPQPTLPQQQYPQPQYPVNQVSQPQFVQNQLVQPQIPVNQISQQQLIQNQISQSQQSSQGITQQQSFNQIPNNQKPVFVPSGNTPHIPTFPSPELASGIESTNTLGQPIYEQHTPPKFSSHPLTQYTSFFHNLFLNQNQNYQGKYPKSFYSGSIPQTGLLY